MISTYMIMAAVVLFLAIELIWGAKTEDSTAHFFDLDNTKAMRGFWCLIVILVHVPRYYQNSIQDMIGSFAFIGVTFFFMTSGYGLTLSLSRKPDNIKIFWRKHLPKLLVTNWLINILFGFVNHMLYDAKFTAKTALRIDDWVQWLLGCYVLFWVAQMIFRKKQRIGFVAGAVLIVITSIVFYFLGKYGIVTSTIWSVECLGFVWGTVLALCYDRIVEILKCKWIRNIIIGVTASLVLGVLYLKLKNVVFAGDYLLKILLGVAITILVLTMNVKICIGNKVSLFLGDISFEIYLVQWEAFALVALFGGNISSGLFILTSLILAVILATICHFIAKPIISGISHLFLSHSSR